MKLFLSISAVLAWLFGIGLLFFPNQFNAPLGIVMTPILATVAQAHGATLIGLGTLNWFARKAEGQGLRAVLIGNLTVQALSFCVAIRIFMLVGAKDMPALIIHTVLGSFFAYFLFKGKKS